MSSPFYPQVCVGMKVLHGTGPNLPESQWRLGEVLVLKNDSCDIGVFKEAGLVYQHDCIFIDDPRCTKTTDWAGPNRGVFKLLPADPGLEEIRKRLAACELRIAGQAKAIEDMNSYCEILERRISGRAKQRA